MTSKRQGDPVYHGVDLKDVIGEHGAHHVCPFNLSLQDAVFSLNFSYEVFIE